MQDLTVLVFRSSYCEINQRSFEGIHSVAKTEGWNLQTIEYGRATGSVWPVPSVDSFHIDVPKILAFWNPDGCIVESSMGPWGLCPKDFRSVPTVFFEWHPSQLPTWASCVFNDGAEIAACAARELMSLGLEHFAYVPYAETGGAELYWSRNRCESFARILEMNGKCLSSVAGGVGSGTVTGSNEPLRDWVSALPKPCGIFAANDLVARNVLIACRASDIAVPDSVSVIGVDNATDLCENQTPTLSSVRPDNEDSGRVAAQFLMDMMNLRVRKSRGVFRTYGAQGVVRRESTRRYPGMDARVRKALEFIRKHACDGIGPSEVFAEMGCSRSLANLRFRQALGHSILDEIHSVRLEKVKEQLSKTSQEVSTLPDFCGYASLSDLRRVFRQRVGCTMGAYRRQNQA